MIPGVVASQLLGAVALPGDTGVGTAVGIGLAMAEGVALGGFTAADGTAIGIGSATADAAEIRAAIGTATGLGAATGAGPWAPSVLGSAELKAWYDFSDTSSITESGGAVSQVNDKSGNANHIAQSTAGAKPTTGTQTLNGLNVLVFDGGDDLNKTSGTSLPSANPGAMLFVLRLHTSGTSGGLTWITQNGASTGDNCSLGRDVGNTGAWGNGTNNSTTTAAIYSDSDNTNWHLVEGVYTTASRSIYQDGTSQNTNVNAVTVSTPERIYVGLNLARDRSAGRNLTGRIAQVLVVNGTDTTTRQKIEGWALWKYGLQANLPGGHPYASAPP